MNDEEKKDQLKKEVVQQFVKTAAAFQRVFSGAEGELVYDYLKTQTAGFNIDPYQHAFNAGKTRMLQIIDQMCDDKQYKKHVEYLQNATTTQERKEE